MVALCCLSYSFVPGYAREVRHTPAVCHAMPWSAACSARVTGMAVCYSRGPVGTGKTVPHA